MARRKTRANDETDVLLKSARRCALCYYLVGDLTEKRISQIAHIDHDSSNSKEDNLVFLCIEHHSLYDSKTSQHKNYTEGEVRRARTMLYGAIAAKEHFKRPIPPRSYRRKKPALNVVYVLNQCIWSIGGMMQPNGKTKKMMQIMFWAILTTDSDEPLAILEAYPEGSEPQLSAFSHTLTPRRPERTMISAFVLPIIGTPGQPLRTRFVLKDQYGRTYYTPKTAFRWVSSGVENMPD